MRTKNLTPFPLGTRLTSTKPPQPEMVVIVRGRFDLVHEGAAAAAKGLVDAIAQGPLSADVFEDDDEARAGEPVYPSDFADAKLAAEVIVRGTCHPPGKHAVPESTVAVSLGAWSKSLAVFGPRVKGRAPESFTSMRLRWSKALGGPGVAENPVGVGKDGTGLLPNVEFADGRAAPAGLGPINPAWQARATKVGVKYGASYLPRAPYYAEDFDWTYFQAAPVDQRLPRFPIGDEELVLTHLCPSRAVLRTKLPGLRVRCFVNDVGGAMREVRLLLDTIFVDGDAEQVCLTWRGRTPVTDTEFDDVRTLFVASEPLGDPAKSEEHYRAAIGAFEADPLGLADALPPEEAAVARAKTPAERDAALAALIERDQPAYTKAANDGDVPTAAELVAHAQKTNSAVRPPDVPPPAGPRTTLDREALREARAAIAAHKPGELPAFDAKLAALAELDPNLRPPFDPPGDAAPGPGVDLSGRDFTGQDLTGIDLSGAKLSGAVLERAKLRGAKLTGANLEGAMLFRADLTDADLRGARLVRVNAADAILVGARLDDAVLERGFFARADGRGARFDGAKATQAMFVEAELSGASFARATLHQCDFSAARATGARFTGAKLTRAVLHKAVAADAIFDDCEVDNANFEEATLQGASFQGARGRAASFIGADLERADLRWSALGRCHFTRARLVRARLDAADVHGARFFKADLEGASLVDAKLCGADLCKTEVGHARFDRANLYDAKLLGARGLGTSFEGANLVRCKRPS